MSNVRIKCGKLSTSLCFNSLLNGPLPSKSDFGIKLNGGGGIVLGADGMIGIGQLGGRGEGREAVDVGLTNSSEGRNKNGLSLSNIDK